MKTGRNVRLLSSLTGIALASSISATQACSEDAPEAKPHRTVPSTDDDDSAPVDAGGTSSSSSSSGDTVVDAATGGAAVTYRGTLDTTPTTPFGNGTQSCKYLVAMKNIVVEIAITPDGEVIGGSATNDMVETLAETCVNKPLGTKKEAFTAGTMKAPDTLGWVGAAANGPKMDLTTTLTKAGQSYQAALKWVRTDQPSADLAWTVTTTITLGPK